MKEINKSQTRQGVLPSCRSGVPPPPAPVISELKTRIDFRNNFELHDNWSFFYLSNPPASARTGAKMGYTARRLRFAVFSAQHAP